MKFTLSAVVLVLVLVGLAGAVADASKPADSLDACGDTFKSFSEAYARFFGTTGQPNIVARTTMQVAALANPAFLVEIEAIAAKAPGS